jgi:hypothetical protein
MEVARVCLHEPAHRCTYYVHQISRCCDLACWTLGSQVFIPTQSTDLMQNVHTHFCEGHHIDRKRSYGSTLCYISSGHNTQENFRLHA